MSEDAGTEPTGTEQVEQAETARPQPPTQPVIITGRGGISRGQDQAREEAILSGRPVAVFKTPSGKELPVYPKAQGYFYKIEEAANAYIRSLASYDNTLGSRLWSVRPFRWFVGFRRRKHITAIESAKYNLLRLIFEDRYNAERNAELTVADFLAMPHDTVLHILDAYRKANDVTDILKRLVPEYEKKKELLVLARSRAFMHI